MGVWRLWWNGVLVGRAARGPLAWLARLCCDGLVSTSQRVARTVGVSACLLLVVAFGAPVAEAGYEWLGPTQGEFALLGAEGDLSLKSGVAVDYASGDVYVADGFNHRVTTFDSKGEFLGAWGWDVTATGPDKSGIDQVEAVTIAATGGEFALEYQGEVTKELAFEASPNVVENALNSLKSLSLIHI